VTREVKYVPEEARASKELAVRTEGRPTRGGSTRRVAVRVVVDALLLIPTWRRARASEGDRRKVAAEKYGMELATFEN
jgi:hypothetical protein